MALTIVSGRAAKSVRRVVTARPAVREPLRYAPSSRTAASNVVGLYYCFGGTGALLGARFPMSPGLAIGLSQFLGVVSLAIAVTLFALRNRVGLLTLNAAVAVSFVMISTLVAATGSAVGVLLPGVLSICGALSAAYFFPPAWARAQALLAAGGFSAAVLASGVPGLLVPWFVITVAVLGGSELLRHFVAQLHQQAAFDPLTGLANRAYFQLAAEREFALAARGPARFSLAIIDLDNFKAVNDTQGHAAGDALLTELARAWQGQVRRTDLLARYGGDEFALIMPDTDAEEAGQIVERLRAAHHARWSVGVATWDGDSDLNQLLRRADHALYRAKDARTR